MKILIIGAGLTGVTLANKLVKNHDVAVIEKGPQKGTKLPSDFGQSSSLAKVPTFVFGQGGTTNLWHNGLITPKEITHTCSTYKYIFESISNYFSKAASYLGFEEKHPYIDDYQDKNSPLGLVTNKIYYPYQIKKLKLDPRVEAFYDVSNFYIDRESKKVGFGVETVNYDKLIISAGGLSTPEIIYSILQKKTSETSYLDHPMGFVGKVKVKKQFSDLFQKYHEQRLNKGVLKTAFEVPYGKHTSAFYLRPSGSLDNSLELSHFKSKIGASNGFIRLLNCFNFKIFHPDLLEEAFNRFFGVRFFKRYYTVLFVGEQLDKSNLLTSDKVEMNISKSDMKAFREQIKQIEHALTPYCDKVVFKPTISSIDLWSAAHYSSSLPTSDYINKDLSLKGVEDVYICDASILAKTQYVNTGVMLASLAFYMDEVING